MTGILFLDDNPQRQKAAARYLGPALTAAHDASTAITAMEFHVFETIYLDHDLGGEQDEPTSEGGDGLTGMAAVDWLVENGDRSQKIVVHSLNEPARIAMVGKLMLAGFSVQPFPFTLLLQGWSSNEGQWVELTPSIS